MSVPRFGLRRGERRMREINQSVTKNGGGGGAAAAAWTRLLNLIFGINHLIMMVMLELAAEG